jgi:hypothetical protein
VNFTTATTITSGSTITSASIAAKYNESFSIYHLGSDSGVAGDYTINVEESLDNSVWVNIQGDINQGMMGGVKEGIKNVMLSAPYFRLVIQNNHGSISTNITIKYRSA